MIGRIIYAIGGIIEVLVALRFIFRLVGANASNVFVEFVYNLSTPLVAPFAGILGQDATVAGQGAVTASVVDWTALIALVVYGLVFGVVGRLLTGATRRAA